MESEDGMQGKEWYLIQCKASEAHRAFFNLENQQYHCFLPSVKTEKIIRNKRTLVEEPLFPGYLFIELDKVADNWRPIRSTRGVIRLVTFGQMPVPVEPEIIQSLKLRCQHHEVLKSLKQGEAVRIKEGPFKELEAVFDSFDGEERVVILLDFLQTQQRLKMPASGIDKIR